MIVLIRHDGIVMNDIVTNDWDPAKQAKLEALQETLDNLQPQDEGARKDIETAIAILENDHANWQLRRRNGCVKMFGGAESDYSCLSIPGDKKGQAMSARYITFDGEDLTYDNRPTYLINESVITCTSGWVRGNERLLEDDDTDFSSLSLTEPLYFRLVYAKNEQTENISVQLLTRYEHEDFGTLPGNLQLIRPIVEGRVNVDNTISEGVF